MPKTYASTPTGLTPGMIDDDVLLAIGRLVRACAELEDMLMLFICNLSGLSEAKTVVMLGRMPVSQRIEIAGRLAALYGQTVALEIHELCFDVNYKELVDCRNDVVHGVFLGYDEGGALAFLAQRASGVSEAAVRQQVASYSPAQIKEAADLTEERVRDYPAILKIEKKRAARARRMLFPHPAAKKQSKTKKGK